MQQNQQQLEQQDEEEDKCAICFEEFTDKSQLIDYGYDDGYDEAEFAACEHEFCFLCISTWRFKSCPLCRETFSIIEGESGKRKVLRPRFFVVGGARGESESSWGSLNAAGSEDDDDDSDTSWVSGDALLIDEEEEDEEELDDDNFIVEEEEEEAAAPKQRRGRGRGCGRRR